MLNYWDCVSDLVTDKQIVIDWVVEVPDYYYVAITSPTSLRELREEVIEVPVAPVVDIDIPDVEFVCNKQTASFTVKTNSGVKCLEK